MASGFFTTGTQSDTEAEEERMFRERTRTRRAIGGGAAGSGGVGFGTPVRLVRRRTVTPNTFTSGGRKRRFLNAQVRLIKQTKLKRLNEMKNDEGISHRK